MSKATTTNLFQGDGWNSFLEEALASWADHAERWIDRIRNGTVLFYEDLTRLDTESEVRRLLRVFGFGDGHQQPIDDERLQCALYRLTPPNPKLLNNTPRLVYFECAFLKVQLPGIVFKHRVLYCWSI